MIAASVFNWCVGKKVMRRWLLCGVAMIGMGIEASAADMPDFLRGSSTVVAAPSVGPRWDGVYFGAHVGWSVTGVDFAHDTSSVAAVLSGSPVTSITSTPLGAVDSTSAHFGAFAGYQQQWGDAVVGLEGMYNWVDKSMAATNGISGGFAAAPNALTYTAAGLETARIIDYSTLRLRGGWAAGMFMPYATFGLAVGRMDINRAVVVTPSATAGTPPGTFVPAPFTLSQNINNTFAYGYSAGLGIDFCLMANLFARAEYEYVQFIDVQGLNVHMQNVRVGAAYKF